VGNADQAQYFDIARGALPLDGVIADLASGQATAADGKDTLSDIERLVGSPFNDVLIGDPKSNSFIGLQGDDMIDGRGGIDGVKYNFLSDPVTVNLATRMATGQGTDTLRRIESVVGTVSADVLIGDGNQNQLSGIGGDDVIDGGDAADTLFGGTGNDILHGGKGNDALNGEDGTDTGDGGHGHDSCNAVEIVIDCS
jgi:Ca2+-binding RTX toxin-like protein